MEKEYIIGAPTLSRRNGVRALYLLYINLERRGAKVRLHSPGYRIPEFKYIDESEITEDIRNNAIAIYPEVAKGNPLKIKNVVRYVLYYPGILGHGTRTYHESEFIVTHHDKFYPGAFKLTMPWIDKKIFYDNNSPKTHNCYFIHKQGKFRPLPELEGAIEINMTYPETKRELAELLRSTDTLYSFDPCTSLMDEAKLCGAKIKIVTEEGFAEYEEDYEKQIAGFEESMAKFIEITQNLNYAGPIEGEEVTESVIL